MKTKKKEKKKGILKKKIILSIFSFSNPLWILFAWQLPRKHTNHAFGAACSSLGSEEHAALQPAHNSTSIMFSAACWILGFCSPITVFHTDDFLCSQWLRPCYINRPLWNLLDPGGLMLHTQMLKPGSINLHWRQFHPGLPRTFEAKNISLIFAKLFLLPTFFFFSF